MEKEFITRIDHELVYRRDEDGVRRIALMRLYNGTYVVCDWRTTTVYSTAEGASRAWHALVDSYADQGWSVEQR